ncbi:putative peroxidase 61 [Sesamum alatum]|uniref:Peroxidase 61 n=1 Tax=Sesamum alatum TaxID=300844 RepID=A0AAE2CK16_9LAMI|nr:putative peroxidase 61 [Sesamum alatum]
MGGSTITVNLFGRRLGIFQVQGSRCTGLCHTPRITYNGKSTLLVHTRSSLQLQQNHKPDLQREQSTLDKLRRQCPSSLKKGQEDQTVFLTDKYGPEYKFTNDYYSTVEVFRQGFALSISRMGGLKVLTGKQGEIRRNCRFTNKNNPHIK